MNQIKNHGLDRDCFIINEDCHTPTHQQMFKFLGVLFGHCFRSKSCMPFKLAPAVWKTILELKPLEDDLNSIDSYTWQTFKSLRKNAKKYKSEEEFEAIVCQNFTFGNDEVPLCDNGKERMVNQSNLEEFIKLTCNHIFNSAKK